MPAQIPHPEQFPSAATAAATLFRRLCNLVASPTNKPLGPFEDAMKTTERQSSDILVSDAGAQPSCILIDG